MGSASGLAADGVWTSISWVKRCYVTSVDEMPHLFQNDKMISESNGSGSEDQAGLSV